MGVRGTDCAYCVLYSYRSGHPDSSLHPHSASYSDSSLYSYRSGHSNSSLHPHSANHSDRALDSDRPRPSRPRPSIPKAPTIPIAVSVEDASVARYIVGEELRRLDLPIKATGETSEVSGSIVFDGDGVVNSDSSLLKVGLSGFRSDEDRRDRWVRSSLFNTGRFPNAELAVTGFDGLPWPLPESGEATFKLNGDLTIQEVTRPVSWDVTAQFADGTFTGQAKTMVTFEQFELSKPTFAFILSVENEIFLEIDIVASIE